MKKIMIFLREEEGASLIEYALLAALIGVATIGAMQLVGGEATNTLETAGQAMHDVT